MGRDAAHHMQIGSCRGVGMRFVTKDGNLLSVLVDAEINDSNCVNVYAYAAIYDFYDPEES